MFLRAKRSVREGTTYEYLQIVRTYREGEKVRQQVLASLGRRDRLVASGELDALVRSLARFSERLKVVEAVREGHLEARSARAWGPALVFGRLWKRQGLPALLARLARGRRFGFDVERAVFAMALQRLCAPGFEALQLQHFYRACAFLAGVREELEAELFAADRDLFSQTLDLVFIDTTSVYVYRDSQTEWRRRGYSRDRRGDLPQLVLGVAVDRRGWPVAWQVFPGNTADTKALEAIVGGLRERFAIGRVVVVADRGMISAGTIRLLTGHETAPFDYILGCRLRRSKEVTEQVLSRAGRYREVADNLSVKQVRVEDRRYVVCYNPLEAQKDAAARAALLDKLQATLASAGPKAIIGNKGFARFVKVSKGAVSIDRTAVERDARFDGTFVLTTNTDLPPEEVALAYKSLWRVERAFRETKSTLEVRPVYHHRDDTTIGHITAAFLALRLEVDLQRRLDQRGTRVAWSTLMRDLASVQAVTVEADGQRYLLRTDLAGSAHHAFAAAGVRPPSPAQLLPPPGDV